MTSGDNACGLAQLSHTFPPSILYSNYWYRSGTNETMRDHLRGIVESTREVMGPTKGKLRVLDIGCHQGEMFKQLAGHIGKSVGIDPLARPVDLLDIRLMAIGFSGELPFPDACFEVVTLLATLEHMDSRDDLARECRRVLVPLGRTVLTVPQPAVEKLLELLLVTRMVDGMSLEEHHGFDPLETERLFCSHGFVLEHHSSFQLGMNNLFVFRKEG